MLKFDSKLIKTDVTCTKLFNDYVLCGIGGCLHIFSLKTKELLHKEPVFEGLKINCIQIDQSHTQVLFTAENFLKIYTTDFGSLTFTEQSACELNDWILDAKWLSPVTGDPDFEIATVTMHNRVQFWDRHLLKSESMQCEENCILYCALISYECEELVVLAGTVFSEILIWKPDIKEGICLVIKRLSGHNGVLFSIDHDSSKKMIASSSDDRSTIIWKYEGDFENTRKQILLGHTARCFRSKISGKYVISVGEDGIINIWNGETGTLERSLSAHQEASIWSIDADYGRNILITGGGDTGVSIFNIEPIITHSSLPVLPEKSVPKRVAVFENGDVAVVSEQGTLFLWRESDKDWLLVSEHEELKSYCLLEISLCRKQIALAGFHGNIYIYKHSDSKIELDTKFETKSKSRIFSLHWMNCNTFLTCEKDGLLYLRRKELLLEVFELPSIKERWTTCACLCLGGIMVGDRKGNLHLYKYGSFKPVQSFKKAHNYLGVTGLSYNDQIITSLGRDSIIKRYKFTSSNSEHKLTQISEDKVPFAWLTSLDHRGILTAFNGSRAVFWDYSKRRTVLEFECGGGHRSWSFLNKREKALFVFIKDKTVNRVCFDWNSNCAVDLTVGINACAEINSLCCYENRKGLILITGGEDTTLRLSKFQQDYVQTAVLKSHLSSIRCLHLNRPYLFTAGGRGQIIMWRVEEEEINCVQLYSYYEQLDEDECEVRVMDLTTCFIENDFYLLAACSDGKIKVFLIDADKFTYIDSFQYERKCILKITILNQFLISMATDGYLTFWNFNDKIKCVYKIKAHKSGINSYSHMQTNTGTHLILTGGDDNALTLNEFQIISEFEIVNLRSCTKCDSHCAQITGVHLSSKHMLSVGLDKRLLVYEFSNLEKDLFKIVCKGAYETSVSDVKGVIVNEHNSDLQVILYGLGLEILNIVIQNNKVIL